MIAFGGFLPVTKNYECFTKLIINTEKSAFLVAIEKTTFLDGMMNVKNYTPLSNVWATVTMQKIS